MTLDDKKTRAEEDVKNPKLLPLLRDAYGLVMKIDKAFERKEKNVAFLDKSKKALEQPLNAKNTSTDKPTADASSKYKTIMCPLGILCPSNYKDQCSTDAPQSYKCPYAHHYSELHFA